MKILLFVIIVLYGGATFIAGSVKILKDKDCDIATVTLMVGASIMMYGGVFAKKIIIIVIGLILIHVGAAGVGLKVNGKINKTHQFIRGVISVVITGIFVALI